MSWQLGAHPDDVPRAEVDAPRAVAEPVADDRPVGERPVMRTGQVVMRPRAYTPQATALALLPLAPVLLSMCAPAFAGAGGWDISVVLGFCVPIALVQFVLALRDNGTLRQRGFIDLPSALLALLPSLLYLLLRARAAEAMDRDARAPVPWAIAATAIAVLMVVIGFGFQLAMSPLFTGGGQE